MPEIFTVSDETKIQLAAIAMPQLLGAIAEAAGGESNADDVIDTLAICIAMILDNDTYLTSPSHLRRGADTAAKHILRRTKELRALQAEKGFSSLEMLLGAAATGQPTN